MDPREASADPHFAPTTLSSLRKGKSGPTRLGVGKGGEGRPLSSGRHPAETKDSAKGDAAPASQAINAPSGPVLPTGPPPHLRTPERLHLRTPGPPPQQPAGREPRLSKPGPHRPRPCHGPATLPGDVEGQRGPQNRVASELPERPRAESSHLEAIQAAAPAAAGTSRLATPSSACGKKSGRGKACVRVT